MSRFRSEVRERSVLPLDTSTALDSMRTDKLQSQEFLFHFECSTVESGSGGANNSVLDPGTPGRVPVQNSGTSTNLALWSPCSTPNIDLGLSREMKLPRVSEQRGAVGIPLDSTALPFSGSEHPMTRAEDGILLSSTLRSPGPLASRSSPRESEQVQWPAVGQVNYDAQGVFFTFPPLSPTVSAVAGPCSCQHNDHVANRLIVHQRQYQNHVAGREAAIRRRAVTCSRLVKSTLEYVWTVHACLLILRNHGLSRAALQRFNRLFKQAWNRRGVQQPRRR